MSSGIGRRKEAKAARRKKLLAERRKLAFVETPSSRAEQIRRLATAPLHACLVQTGLFEQGNGMVLLIRKTAGGRVALAAFLVDVYCLGVKDVVFRQDEIAEIEAFIETLEGAAPFEDADPSYARKLLRDAVAYARSLGFEPPKDYAALDLLFGDSRADACDVSFSFGHDGKPLYIPGASETRAQIRRRLAHLRRRLGDDSFDFLIDDDDGGNDEDADFDLSPGSEWDADGEQDYDPAEAPDPVEWLALDEQDRQDFVLDFHRRARIRLPNDTIHAIFHVIVENQIALGDELPVRRTVERLMAEGLDRHDALHAVGSVLAKHMHATLQGAETSSFPEEAYNAAVERLTAANWLEEGDSDDDADEP